VRTIDVITKESDPTPAMLRGLGATLALPS
jgi:hypothetical protein